MGGWEVEEGWVTGDFSDLFAIRAHFLDITFTGEVSEREGVTRHFIEMEGSPMDVFPNLVGFSAKHPEVTFYYSHAYHHKFSFVTYTVFEFSKGVGKRFLQDEEGVEYYLTPEMLARYSVEDIYAVRVHEVTDDAFLFVETKREIFVTSEDAWVEFEVPSVV